MVSSIPIGMERPLLALLFLLATSCTSLGGHATKLASCDDDPRLHGSWRSYRFSQLGPAWTNFTFEPGCVYRASFQLVWMRSKEEGNYRVEAGTLVLSRGSRTTRMPYHFDGDALVLQESKDEVYTYRRTASVDDVHAHDTRDGNHPDDRAGAAQSHVEHDHAGDHERARSNTRDQRQRR